MKWVYDDGGRTLAGYTGKAGDCVVRAVAIATEQNYQTVYDALSSGMKEQRITKRSSGHTTARDGVSVRRKWFKDYLTDLGWAWCPTMFIGSGCTVHLADGELPPGRLIVSLSRHYTTVIDGVIHDLYNPDRDGCRCVYGYWLRCSSNSNTFSATACRSLTALL